jgi:hypothetical protein
LLHLAIYDNALQFVNSEADIVLLHLLLSKLVDKLGVNAVKEGLPMIFRLQEDILEAETPLAKIRIGSLCHGYFQALSEKFDFDASPIGRTITNEIKRRRQKKFWVERIRYPPVPLDEIETPKQDESQSIVPDMVESESLTPFDDRFQLVKLISLIYAQSVSSPPTSAPSSPGRSFNQPILSGLEGDKDAEHALPEVVKEAMMAEWSRELAIAAIQAGSKTASLNGSKAGTNTTGRRNFLAVNGQANGSGSQSPKHHIHSPHSHGSKPNSTYGLVGGIGSLKKIRKGSGFSTSPTSEDSHSSVARFDQLKRALSGKHANAGGRNSIAHSDASSESMVSYDYPLSELSINPTNSTSRDRPASQRDRSRSKSRDRGNLDHLRPLSSHAVMMGNTSNVGRSSLEVPPVPRLPSPLPGTDGAPPEISAQPDISRKSRSVKRSTKSRGGQSFQSSSWENEKTPMADLESLLKGIDSGPVPQQGTVSKPPY